MGGQADRKFVGGGVDARRRKFLSRVFRHFHRVVGALVGLSDFLVVDQLFNSNSSRSLP